MRLGGFLFGLGVAASMVFIATLIIFTFTYAVVGPIKASQILPSMAASMTEGPTVMHTDGHQRSNVGRP